MGWPVGHLLFSGLSCWRVSPAWSIKLQSPCGLARMGWAGTYWQFYVQVRSLGFIPQIRLEKIICQITTGLELLTLRNNFFLSTYMKISADHLLIRVQSFLWKRRWTNLSQINQKATIHSICTSSRMEGILRTPHRLEHLFLVQNWMQFYHKFRSPYPTIC